MFIQTHMYSEFNRGYSHEIVKICSKQSGQDKIILSHIWKKSAVCWGLASVPRHQKRSSECLILQTSWMHFKIHLAMQHSSNWIVPASIAPYLGCTLMVPEGITGIQTKKPQTKNFKITRSCDYFIRVVAAEDFLNNSIKIQTWLIQTKEILNIFIERVCRNV